MKCGLPQGVYSGSSFVEVHAGALGSSLTLAQWYQLGSPGQGSSGAVLDSDGAELCSV